jgi:type I restriction enzyme M protein
VINELNQYGINPFYLLYLFSHKLTQKQLYNKIMIDTTLPNIGRRWEELYLPISKSIDEREDISNRIKQAFIKRWDAQKDILSIMNDFGSLTR